MKNIHVLPTDKPSRLCIDNSCNELNYSQIEGLSSKHITNQNIYITSDEKIKEGDWFLNDMNILFKAGKNYIENPAKEVYIGHKKIILTTDQDLIKDGVQAIDDEFLEWFVKNPSCERVEVLKQGVKTKHNQWGFTWKYFIKIPKEEPKQDFPMQKLIDIMENDEELRPKQETLESLEVPMPIQNKSISSWNKSNTTPNFDGEYLCYIRCREECGNVHSYYKVVSNSFNTWLINENERVALWKELPKNPFND